jgi:hypothetical protein
MLGESNKCLYYNYKFVTSGGREGNLGAQEAAILTPAVENEVLPKAKFRCRWQGCQIFWYIIPKREKICTK